MNGFQEISSEFLEYSRIFVRDIYTTYSSTYKKIDYDTLYTHTHTTYTPRLHTT